MSLRIKKSDAALVFNVQGGLSVIYPECPGDELVPQHILACMALAVYVEEFPEVLTAAMDRFQAKSDRLKAVELQ